MISTEPLEKTLSAPGVRELGLDDRALEEILSLASRDEFMQAAERSQKLWQEQIYDVRTLGCYLFGVFFERGVPALSLIFDCINRALRENLKFLGPTYKRERHLDGSLRWLFDTIINRAHFHERQKDAVWAKWNEDWQRMGQQTAIERCSALLKTLDEVLPGGRARQPLFHVQSLLEGMARASAISAGWEMKGATQIPAPPPPEDSSKSTPPDEGSSSDSESDSEDEDEDDDLGSSRSSSDGGDDDEEEDDGPKNDEVKEEEDDDKDDDKDDDDKDDDDKDDDDDDDSAKSRPASAVSGGSDSDESASRSSSGTEPTERLDLPAPSAQPLSSHATLQPGATLLLTPVAELQALLRALAGFVQLTEKKQYRKAGILLRHIRKTLREFEPTRFFPSLFGDYLLALAHHGAALKSHVREDVDLEQEALEQLCSADLERFLAGTGS